MRVVAGVAGGRLLRAPAGSRTRPTSDRVREAVFSMLESMGELEGAEVVDLFAGSGALGIEALSRGAARATLVERDRAALEAISVNLAVLGPLARAATVVASDALRFAATMRPAGIVFADPPYRFDAWSVLLGSLRRRAGLLVAETGEPLEPGPGWEDVKVKKYGSTVVSVLRPTAPSGGRHQLDPGEPYREGEC